MSTRSFSSFKGLRRGGVAAGREVDSPPKPTPGKIVGKRGPGGYASTSGITATVFGASGFLGRYVVGNLAPKGTGCQIAFRGDADEVRHLKLMGDLGKIGFHPFNARDRDSVRRAVEGSDLVINIIGKHYETKHALPFWINNTFEDVHVQAAQMVADVSAEMGVEQLIHVSALAADKSSDSEWAASKARGEEAVRACFPSATIVRPANMFGDEDRFLNSYAQMARAMPRFFLPGGGKALKQPVLANDVGKAISLMVGPEHHGQTYDLAGPEILTTKEVVEFVFQTIRRPPMVVDLPDLVYEIGALGLEQLPNPMLTRDKLALDYLDCTLESSTASAYAKTFADLGMSPTAMHEVSIRFLLQYRMGGHFLETV